MFRGWWSLTVCARHKRTTPKLNSNHKDKGISNMSSMKTNLAEQTTAEVDTNSGVKDNNDLPVLSVISNKSSESTRRFSWRRLVAVLVLGLASSALYLLLFGYADQLTALSAEARAGAKYYGLVPIIIALVFSLVHGAFTARFWSLLGVRARTH